MNEDYESFDDNADNTMHNDEDDNLLWEVGIKVNINNSCVLSVIEYKFKVCFESTMYFIFIMAINIMVMCIS